MRWRYRNFGVILEVSKMITITLLTTMKPDIAFDFKTAHFSLFKITARRFRNCLGKKKKIAYAWPNLWKWNGKISDGAFLTGLSKTWQTTYGAHVMGGGVHYLFSFLFTYNIQQFGFIIIWIPIRVMVFILNLRYNIKLIDLIFKKN